MGFLKYGLYSTLFLFSVVFGVYQTFPWDVVQERIFQVAKKQAGIELSAERLEPNWVTGIEAEKLEIGLKPGQEPIKFDKFNARAKVLAFAQGKKGFSIAAPVARGQIDADIVFDAETADIEAKVDKVQLEFIPSLRAANFPVSGRVSIESDLTWGIKAAKKTEGILTIKLEDFVAEKGIKLGMFPLPRDFDLGSFELELPMKEGKVMLKNQVVSGKDIELTLDGSITLMNPLARSALNLDVGFKPTEELLKSDPLIKALLKNLKGKKDSKGFQKVKVTGTFRRMYTRT